jgi:hypothetical protein
VAYFGRPLTFLKDNLPLYPIGSDQAITGRMIFTSTPGLSFVASAEPPVGSQGGG